MTMTVRSCTSPDDLAKMKRILVEGRKAYPHSTYIHPGDLDWWIFYLLREYDVEEIAYLWEESDGSVIGWTLLSPGYSAFDLFVHPAVRDDPRVEDMLIWSEAGAAHKAHRRKKALIYTMWVFEDDARWIGLLEGRGFVRVPDYQMHYLVHPLDDAPPPSTADLRVPPGFVVRPFQGDQDTAARAAAHRAAFRSQGMTPEAYRRFQQAPGYSPARDLMAVTPDGTVAAYAMTWLDPENRTGALEPVGTHPDFQRRGLGRAVILEGLRRLRADGAESATVYVEDDNHAARALYESVGFQSRNRIHAYVKAI